MSKDPKPRDATLELRALQSAERQFLAAGKRYGSALGAPGPFATKTARELDAAARAYWDAIEDYRKTRGGR